MTNSFSNNLDLCVYILWQCLVSGEEEQVALEESACILTKHEVPYRLPNHIGCLRRKQTHYCFLQTSLIRDCQWQYHKVDQSLTWINLNIILYSRSEHHLLFAQTTIHRQHSAWHIYSTSLRAMAGQIERRSVVSTWTCRVYSMEQHGGLEETLRCKELAIATSHRKIAGHITRTIETVGLGQIRCCCVAVKARMVREDSTIDHSNDNSFTSFLYIT